MSTPTPAFVTRRPRRAIGGHTLWFLAGYYFLCFVSGMRTAFAGPSMLDLMIPLGYAIALCVWALADARRRGHRIPLLSKSWFVLGYFVTVPGYVIWSRRWWGLLWLLVHAVLGFVVTLFATVVFWLLLYLGR